MEFWPNMIPPSIRSNLHLRQEVILPQFDGIHHLIDNGSTDDTRNRPLHQPPEIHR
jgi:hypothetical protein